MRWLFLHNMRMIRIDSHWFASDSHRQMHPHGQPYFQPPQIACILHCVFSNVSSKRVQNHIGYICLTFLHCALSKVSSKRLPEKMHSHIDCICSTFHHCAFSNVSSNCLLKKRHNRTGYICLTFLHCVFKCLFKSSAREDAKLHFTPLCVFKCLLESPACEDAKSHWLHFFDFSPLCILRCVLKWCIGLTCLLHSPNTRPMAPLHRLLWILWSKSSCFCQGLCWSFSKLDIFWLGFFGWYD